MRRLSLMVLFLLPATSALSDTSREPNEEIALFDRLNMREQILDGQRTASENTTRDRALLAYRLAARRTLGFAANPENRLDDARALDLALLALRRGFDEMRALANELDRVRLDRTALENALVTRAIGESSTSEDVRSDNDQRGQADGTVRLLRPLRGIPVDVPGSRRDGPTRIELRHQSVDMLARLNEPVRAIAAGVVKRVESLPQGGFAVVTTHPGGLTSIVTGLRDVTVNVGDQVGAGQTLGLAGRNLDGAAIVSLEIWRNRRAQDAAKLLHVRLPPASGLAAVKN
jgi:murein DD-endopeptidase MepM/ murein hydrolase activator NlpD